MCECFLPWTVFTQEEKVEVQVFLTICFHSIERKDLKIA
jgi:hypothetical protein